MAESFTPNIALSKFAQGERFPVISAIKLNANWSTIDDAIQTLFDDVAPKASQSSVDTLQSDLDALIAEIAAETFVKANGSVPMTGDLDFQSAYLPKNLPAPMLDGHAARKKYVDDAVTAAQSGLGVLVLGVMSRLTNFNWPGSSQAMPFTTEDVDVPGGMIDIAGNPTRLTAPQAGWYFIFYDLATTNGTVMRTNLTKNGSATPFYEMDYARGAANSYGDSGIAASQVAGPFLLAAGDYIKLFVVANDGSSAVDMQGFTEQGGVTKPMKFGMYLLVPTGTGGGDLKANGTVPMTADLDFGGFKGENGADATDPTDFTTLQQVQAADASLQAQISAISAGQLIADEAEMVAGDQAFSTGAWTVITGSSKVFTIGAAKDVVVEAEATLGCDFQGRLDGQLGIRVAKTAGATTDYPGTAQVFGFPYADRAPLVCKKRLKALAAGEYTVSMIVRQRAVLGASGKIFKNANEPARLGYAYTG